MKTTKELININTTTTVLKYWNMFQLIFNQLLSTNVQFKI